MYNIVELNDKLLAELKVIAKEMGLKKVDALKKEDLIYKILDQQAKKWRQKLRRQLLKRKRQPGQRLKKLLKKKRQSGNRCRTLSKKRLLK